MLSLFEGLCHLMHCCRWRLLDVRLLIARHARSRRRDLPGGSRDLEFGQEERRVFFEAQKRPIENIEQLLKVHRLCEPAPVLQSLP